jgi:hypothetical protein
MPFVALAILVGAVLTAVALMPVSLLMRYRAGTARRRARGWVAALNLALFGLSAILLLAGAAVTNLWLPSAFRFTVLGLAGGALLGVIGLLLSRWERSPESLHYTPNRVLVLAVTLVVTARLCYGFWRGWQAWAGGGAESWFVALGPAATLGAGAVVVGYYLAYWVGLASRLRRFRLRGS